MTRVCMDCQLPLPEHEPGRGMPPKLCDVCREIRARASIARALERQRLKRLAAREADRAAAGTRICQLDGCENEIPAERTAQAIFCSKACKNTSSWRKTRAARDARHVEEDADDRAQEARGHVPQRKKHKRGSRNEQALEPEAVRRGYVKAQVGTRLWEINQSIMSSYRSSVAGQPAREEPVAA